MFSLYHIVSLLSLALTLFTHQGSCEKSEAIVAKIEELIELIKDMDEEKK